MLQQQQQQQQQQHRNPISQFNQESLPGSLLDSPSSSQLQTDLYLLCHSLSNTMLSFSVPLFCKTGIFSCLPSIYYSTYVPLLVCSWHLCTNLHILILDIMSYFDLVGWHSFWKKKNKFGRWLSGWRNYPWRAIKRMLTVLSLSIKLDAQFHHEINHQSEDGTT